jgi:predicted TIM-barrel fold metal-dependent hydrolase
MDDTCIDVFCHCLPPAYCDAANRAAVRPLHMFRRAQAIPVMVSLDARFKVMDQFPGYRQILSLSSPPLELIAGPDATPELARIGNDALAEMVVDHADRFPGFVASLPMNRPDAAMAEAKRAVTDLGAAGVQVLTNVNGRPIDTPEVLALFELMAVLGRAVWLHPTRGMRTPDYANESVSKYDLWWALGWPYETSLAMARLVFAGIFDRCPDLVIVTHHAGGMIPMMEGRLGPGLDLLGTRVPPGMDHAVQTPLKQRPIDAFRRFYADTATFGSRAAIECGLAFFGADRLMFATDSPFDPEQGPGYIRTTLEAIEAMQLTPQDRERILCGNARRCLTLHV